MKIEASRVDLTEILPLRALFLQENKFQVRYNACHERGWSNSYLLTIDGAKIGYGSTKSLEKIDDRDAIFELFVAAPFRGMIREAFKALREISGAGFIECQSNEPVLCTTMYEFAQNINADVILFDDHLETKLNIDGIVFRPHKKDEEVFQHQAEPIGSYVLEKNGEVVATGGFLLHYNIPFADLYMEVREKDRMRGIGSFLVQ
jgi:hypothetical protein